MSRLDGVEVAVSAAPRSFELSRPETRKKRSYVSVEPARMPTDVLARLQKPGSPVAESTSFSRRLGRADDRKTPADAPGPLYRYLTAQ